MEENNIQTCDCCHKQPAQIYVKGKGKYCVDCYNSAFADLYNWDNDAFSIPGISLSRTKREIYIISI